MRRRDFLAGGTKLLAGAMAGTLTQAAERRLMAQSLMSQSQAVRTMAAQTIAAQTPPDHTIRIAPLKLEIAPGRIVKTTAYNGRVPGELIRVREGQRVTIDVVNETDRPDIVHWHGLHIPSVEDGADEEGSPMSAPHGGVQRYSFEARPAGFRWYHTHTYAGHHLDRATFSGEFGFFMIDAREEPGRYDQEIFLALHDWNGYIHGGSDGYQEVMYNHATINDRMLGHGEPIRVRAGERVLVHLLNTSATLAHTVALPGHHFRVTALDGNPVATQAVVETIRMGPAERVDAVVEMKEPGVWILGETDAQIRRSGMGIVVEYAGQTGEPQWRDPDRDDFHYARFGGQAANGEYPSDEAIPIPLVIRPKFEGYGDFDHWTINGEVWPHTHATNLKTGARYRLILDNQSDDIHPVHLHRHTFAVSRMHGRAISGVYKDVVLLPMREQTELVFTANNPGRTLFHCHQQDHMDSGFMMLLHYA